ncbi:MAG: hypothetical protein CVT49_15745 [candidate division Zixibacteria bacterium HGW-Zixibacteria-1]|nr:MAG: hypothetical protein CVT49_15745 [candidate division Zixibacteria bacterium HGW-Zixibacteria-1]
MILEITKDWLETGGSKPANFGHFRHFASSLWVANTEIGRFFLKRLFLNKLGENTDFPGFQETLLISKSLEFEIWQ